MSISLSRSVGLRTSATSATWARYSGKMLFTGVLLAAFFLPASIAYAHAVLMRSVPADKAVLDAAPAEMRLWFSESVETRFSEVYLLDRAGRRVGTVGPLRPSPGDPTLAIAAVDPLLPGVYTVVWQVVSSIDGHPTAGAFVFAIGQDQVPPGGLRSALPQGGIDTATLLTVLAVAAKWLGYLSTAVLLGGSAFLLWVWREQPGLDPVAVAGKPEKETRPVPAAGRTASGSPPSPLFEILFAGWVLALLSTLVAAIIQGAIGVEIGSAATGGSPGTTLIGGTRQGLLYGIRFFSLALLVAPILHARARARRKLAVRRWVWWMCLVVGSLALVLVSLGGHAAGGIDPFFNIAVDWLHIMAASIWTGGLVMLSMCLAQALRREGSRPFAAISQLVGRFTRLATMCVMVVVLTGIFRAVFEVGDGENLTDTTYGAVLSVKLGLLVALLGLAAVNLFLNGPHLARASQAAAAAQADWPWHRRLEQAVVSEVVVAIAVLLVTGILTTTQPGRDAFGPGLVVRGQGADLRAVLVVRSDDSEGNTLDVYLRDGKGKPLAEADKVAFIFTTRGENRIEVETVADNEGNGRYVAQGRYLSLMDKRNVQLLVRRSGQEDARIILDLSKVPQS